MPAVEATVVTPSDAPEGTRVSVDPVTGQKTYHAPAEQLGEGELRRLVAYLVWSLSSGYQTAQLADALYDDGAISEQHHARWIDDVRARAAEASARLDELKQRYDLGEITGDETLGGWGSLLTKGLIALGISGAAYGVSENVAEAVKSDTRATLDEINKIPEPVAREEARKAYLQQIIANSNRNADDVDNDWTSFFKSVTDLPGQLAKAAGVALLVTVGAVFAWKVGLPLIAKLGDRLDDK